jgi:hypothetical protein
LGFNLHLDDANLLPNTDTGTPRRDVSGLFRLGLAESSVQLSLFDTG